jgi:hypothetical protein
LENFKKNIDSLKSVKVPGGNIIEQFKNVAVSLPRNTVFYTIAEGQQLFSDTALLIKEFAGELKGLKSIKMSKSKQIQEGTSLTFTAAKPVKLLVGYFNEKNSNYLNWKQMPMPTNMVRMKSRSEMPLLLATCHL